MAIHPSGLFDYSVVVRRSTDGVWRGRAEKTPAGGRHPGLAGDEPDVELSGGMLRLQMGERVRALPDPPVRVSGAAHANVSLPVGRLETMLEDGDRLRVAREFTGDLSVVVVREGARIAGFGAVTGRFTAGLSSADDPRVRDEHLYYLKFHLDDPRTTSLWLDVTDPDLDRILARIPDMASGGRMVIAIAGGTRGERVRVNNRISERRSRATSTSFVDVDERFGNEAEWRAYIHGLPSARLADLFIRFTIDGTDMDVLERQYREHPPWQLYVHQVCRHGVPGELSNVAIVQASAGMTEAAIVETTGQIASRHIGLQR